MPRFIATIFYTALVFGFPSYCLGEYQPLRYIGEETTDPEMFPLLKCEGDCDKDAHCDLGYSCFKRDENESVPGCSGFGISAKDYCYEPPPGHLVVKGIEGLPASSFPLGECQGVCDTDGDCELGLSCFDRKPGIVVPDCLGEGVGDHGYCYRPPPGVLVRFGNGGKPASAFPLGECQGECDSDDECDFGLLCFKRTDHTQIPNCEGRGDYGRDYCFKPPPGVLVLAGDRGTPESAFPLKECEGDCDGDGDCRPGLVCFREKTTRFPTVKEKRSLQKTTVSVLLVVLLVAVLEALCLHSLTTLPPSHMCRVKLPWSKMVYFYQPDSRHESLLERINE